MRIGILLAGAEQLATAGVRIRYNRLKPRLEEAGHEIVLLPLDKIKGEFKFDCDAYVFCKCHDARSLLLADMIRRRGIPVGVDFFDDYYSQANNSRFVYLREWFRSIVPTLTFAWCSTSRMQEVLSGLAPDLPIHILNDPFENLDPARSASTVEANVERAFRTRRLDIAWFGMGDNPHFPVGLRDLSAFGEVLAICRRRGYEPRLTILTNRRALDVEALEMIARLGVPCRIEEWTDALERELLRTSVFCFLSVNGQSFSVVKSLNRAVTALTGGTQVLSAGFPLYEDLAPFIYRDVGILLDDIEDRRTALRDKTVPALRALLAAWADPRVEAKRLVSFLVGMKRRGSRGKTPPIRYAIVHGRNSLGAVHKQFQQLKQLSVSSPFSVHSLNYDVRGYLEPVTRRPALLLSKSAVDRLALPVRDALIATVVDGREGFHLGAEHIPADIDLHCVIKNDGLVSTDIASYAGTMQQIVSLLNYLFGDITSFLSELDAQFWAGPQVFRRDSLTSNAAEAVVV